MVRSAKLYPLGGKMPFQYMNSIFEEDSEKNPELKARVLGALPLLPEREAKFVLLYYFKRLKISDIAFFFKCSQPFVSYLLQKAAGRIQYLMELPPDFNAEKVEKTLRSHFEDETDVQVMALMCKTTCQLETARQLTLNQMEVRRRFLSSVKKMQEIPALENFTENFEKLARNLGVLRPTH